MVFDIRATKSRLLGMRILYNVPFITRISFCIDFRLVAKAAECTAKEKWIGYYFDVAKCAFECSRRFSGDVFLFGTNEFGNDRCKNERGCNCYCTNNNMKERDCVTKRHDGYNIYVLDEKRTKKLSG